MMPAVRNTRVLVERLPKVRGRYTENVPLAAITWFRVGGPAEVMFRPIDAEDLAHFLATKPADVPVTLLGVGSNLLVRDGGVRGVVVRLGRGFASIRADGTQIVAGAGALDAHVARTACDAGIAGIEFLSGIPGTVGGALRMNAGAYGTEMKDVVQSVRAVDDIGCLRTLGVPDLGLAYRRCALDERWVFVEATLKGRAGEVETIRRRMEEIRLARESTQPVRARTGGSTFANPPGLKAWELIERAGCRGLRVCGAEVSRQHCNFLINTGDATAADLETLGEEVRRRVHLATGVTLEWEIRRIGFAKDSGPRELAS